MEQREIHASVWEELSMKFPYDRIIHIDVEIAGDEERITAELSSELIHCNECKYFKKISPKSDAGLCHRDIVASVWKDRSYCSRAERK